MSVRRIGAGQGAFGATSKGSPIPFGDIPTRPFLVDAAGDLAPCDEDAVREAVLAHFKKAVDRAASVAAGLAARSR